ncbi:oxidation resistance protein 1-like isoform X5 [Argonauta hians]
MTTTSRNNSGKRPSLKEMAFEKFGFAQRRFRSQSFDSGPPSSSPELLDDPLLSDDKRPTDIKRKKSFQNSYIPEPLHVSVEDEKEKERPPLERKKSKPQPLGTIPYEVTLRDTLVSIAAKFDTTPSNLLQINRMSCRIICPGQVLYVPGPEYEAINNSVDSTSSPTTVNIPDRESPKLDLPLASEKCVSKVPGHAERLSPKEVVEVTDPSRRISEEEARKLDEECVSRFLKFDAKHITDGQGVVNGTLIVTPNAIMFDPSVHDPLVIEHGNDKYGMVAAMETIISAAIYRDLKTMKIKGQADSEESEIPKAEVYCGQGHFKFADNKPDADCDYMQSTSNKLAKIMQAVQSSKEQEQQQQQSSTDSATGRGGGGGSGDVGDKMTMERLNSLTLESTAQQRNGIVQDEGGGGGGGGGGGVPSTVSENGGAEAALTSRAGGVGIDSQRIAGAESGVMLEPRSLSPLLVLQPPRKPHKGVPASEATDVTMKGLRDEESGSQSQQALSDITTTTTTTTQQQQQQSKLSPKDYTTTTSSSTPPPPSSSSSTSNSMMEGSPKLKAIYNYAAGFFHSSGSPTPSSSECPPTTPPSSPTSQPVSGAEGAVLSASPTSPRTPGVEYTTKRGTRVRVVSAVTMEDTPNLFQPVTKLKASLLTIRYEEPPLFLCLKVGKPKHTTVTYEAPFTTYGKAKKPEYWFTVSQEKADNFYAFLLHWKPEIYGDDAETEARKLGFVIYDSGNNQGEDGLDILDGYFGHRDSMSKDWEIVTNDEDYRKKSLEVDDTPILPEFIGETHILNEEQITTLVEHLPGRTVGYSWILIYSTDLHGFSLKTLYRDMANYDSPVLLTVRNTQSQVFGALISCPLKISDHFYGTGESFLFSFHPKFRIFRWTGENNFFVKGNQESLVIGAGKGFFGLWFDGDLYHGRSHPCDTFANEVLCDEEDFVVHTFEAWGFV